MFKANRAIHDTGLLSVSSMAALKALGVFMVMCGGSGLVRSGRFR